MSLVQSTQRVAGLIAITLLVSALAFDARSAEPDGFTRGPLDTTSAALDSLPGNVVEVNAGEFFFHAPDSIPEGLTTFRLRQVGMVVERLKAGLGGRALVADKGDDTRGVHMLWIVRLEDGKTIADLYRAGQNRERMPVWATQLGGPSFAIPPRSSNATLDLTPGNYALVCYIGSAREDQTRAHLLHGMFRALTVLPRPGIHRRAPRPDVTARITEKGIVQLSGPIDAGTRVIRVENTTNEEFEFKFQRMPPGLSGQEFLAQPRGTGNGTPWGGLGGVPPRGVVVTTIDFEPGEYVLGTWPPIKHETSQVIRVVRRP